MCWSQSCINPGTDTGNSSLNDISELKVKILIFQVLTFLSDSFIHEHIQVIRYIVEVAMACFCLNFTHFKSLDFSLGNLNLIFH